MEQKEIKAPEKAVTLISTFQGQFRDICGTFHPAGLPREISGKGSNVAWAAKHIVETRRDVSMDARDVIITVMDGKLSKDYNIVVWFYNANFISSRYPSFAGLLQ
jgi:hypothetical protein